MKLTPKFKMVAGLLACLLSVTMPAHAVLKIELTQSTVSPTPVVILPFIGQDTFAAENFSNIIANNLQNSGRFAPRIPNGSRFVAKSPEDLNFSYWRKKKIENVIIGEIKPYNRTHWQVTYYLLNVYGKQRVQSHKTYVVKAQDMRRLAHRVSDQIYQELTGERGIFSTRIAYIVVDRQNRYRPRYILEVADADGERAQQLLVSHAPIMSPTWSPDGKSIAFVSFEHKKSEIYTIRLATGERTLLTSFDGINGAPAFSPDARYLSLVLSKSGTPNIYLMALKDKHLQKITQGLAIDTEPRWSPDSKSLIFTSDRGGSVQVYRYNLTDRAIERLTFQGEYNASASYTPDGKNIVLLHRENGMYNIAIQDLGSGQLDILTENGIAESPSLAPNGKMIAYATRYGGSGILSIVSTDGQVRLRLPSREGEVQEPAWSTWVDK